MSTSEQKRGENILASKLIWLILYVIEALLALRIIFELTSANPESLTIIFIGRLTSLLLVPFAGLIPSITIVGKMLETTSILAMGIYALAAVAIERLVWLISYRSSRQVANVTETTTNKHHTNP